MGVSREAKKSLKEIVLTRAVRLNAKIYSVVAGVITALAIFVATNWLVLKGGEVLGLHFALLSLLFIEYQVTIGRSLIGTAYGFVCGLVVGALITKLYNWLVNFREGLSRGRSCVIACYS